MAEANPGSGQKAGNRRWVIAAGVGVLMIALAGAVYANRAFLFNSPDAGLAAHARGAMAKLEVPDRPLPAPDDAFEGPDGTPMTLADFQGQVVVLNLWATWCAPCKEEMPTLAALARQVDPTQVAVVVVNVDAVPRQEAPARAFIAENAPLVFYRQPSFTLPFNLPRIGDDAQASSSDQAMPRTVLIDRQGRVRASVTGAADWSGPEAMAAVQALVDEPA